MGTQCVAITGTVNNGANEQLLHKQLAEAAPTSVIQPQADTADGRPRNTRNVFAFVPVLSGAAVSLFGSLLRDAFVVHLGRCFNEAGNRTE